jgi:Ca2+-binding RTX toxin-like protein
MLRTSAVTIAAALALVAVPAAAQAENVTKPFLAPGSVGYGDSQGVPNDITVSSPYNSGDVRFHDDLSNGPAFTAKSPCTVVDAVTADCSLDNISDVVVFPSAGDDTVTIENSINLPATVLGGYGNDIIGGASGNDLLSGNWGNDQVYGGYGDDKVTDSGKIFILFFIPPGIDTWGDGDDQLYGGPGDDWVDGGELPEGTGAGADVLDGGSGNDIADYSHRTTAIAVSEDGKANDGGTGENDKVANVETILSGSGPDKLAADGLGDRLVGAAGDDVLVGGDGADRLYGGAPDDPSGSGNDRLDGGLGPDYLSGGDGHDVVSYANRGSAVKASIDGVANDGVPGEGDNVMGDVEELRGGGNADTLAGSGDADTIFGSDGADTLAGLGGDDFLVGDNGNDTIGGGSGDDGLHGGAGNDVITGGSGDDKIDCGDGDDTVHAGPGDVVAADCEHVDGLPKPVAAGGSPGETPQPGTPGSTGSTGPGTGSGPGTPAAHGPRVTVGPKRVRFNRRGRAALRITCPVGTPGACVGRVTLSLTRGGTLVSARFKVAAGKRKVVRVHLTKRGKRALARKHRVKAKVSARASDSRGATATARGKVTLLRSR